MITINIRSSFEVFDNLRTYSNIHKYNFNFNNYIVNDSCKWILFSKNKFKTEEAQENRRSPYIEL